MGRFLNQDSYLGESNTPPSLHRYLYAYANPTVYIDLDGREAIDKVNGFASAVVNAFFGGPIDYGDRNDLSAQQKKDQKNFSFGDPLLEKSFKVDFRDFSIKKTISKGQTPLQKLVSIATLGLKDAGELIGKTAGAFSVSTDESFSDDIRNQADFEIGSALPGLVSTGIARKGSPKLTTETKKLETQKKSVQGKELNNKTFSPVKELDVGSFKDLDKRAVVGDKLTPDHQPSFAALKSAREKELGRKLNPKEARNLRNDGACIVINECTHRSDSRTFGGRNNKNKINEDSNNLATAAKKDQEAIRGGLQNEGISNERINKSFDELDDLNKRRGIE